VVLRFEGGGDTVRFELTTRAAASIGTRAVESTGGSGRHPAEAHVRTQRNSQRDDMSGRPRVPRTPASSARAG
jgi:hypothetical protein